MKRAISLCLALLLCLGLCACGGTSETIYSIGDTVMTDMVELQLTKVVYDYQYPSPYEFLHPPAGKTFIQVNFSIKNIGKTTVETLPARDGENSSILDSLWLDYNDGYIFMISKEGITNSLGEINRGFLFIESYDFPLEPLSQALDCHPVFCVPKEVIENKEAPLSFSINLPSSDSTYTTMTFKLR